MEDLFLFIHSKHKALYGIINRAIFTLPYALNIRESAIKDLKD